MNTLRALVVLGLMLIPASAQDPGPPATFQTQPISRILHDLRAAAELIADEAGPQFLDEQLRSTLGEKGFSGLDLNRPILGYVIFDDQKPDRTSFVALIGVTNEAEFLDFLKRCSIQPEAVNGQPGVYALGEFELPGDEEKEIVEPKKIQVLARVHGNTAVLGFNVPAAQLAADKLYKPEQLYNPKETALFVYRQFNDRLSPEALKANAKSFEDLMKQFKDESAFGDKDKIVLPAIEKLLQRIMRLNDDATETGTRLTLDPVGGELSVSSYFVPKKDSGLAKLLAARKPATNQFASLAGPTMAAGLLLQLPVGFPEIQELMLAAIESMEEEMKAEPPPDHAKEIVREAIDGLKRTVKSGSCDLAVTISGPDADGHYVAIAAMQFDDAVKIEQAIKAAYPNFPEDEREMLKLDAAKIGNLNVHTLNPPEEGEPEGYSTLFGDRKIYLCFGPKGIYAAVGNGALEALKAAVNAQPAPAAAFDILINPKRLSSLLVTLQPEIGPTLVRIIGSEDQANSAFKLSVLGGENLEVKFGLNLKIFPRMMANLFMSFRE